MKEAIVHPDISVTIHDVPVPTPGRDEVLVRVAVFGTNPKDWKIPLWLSKDQNSGDDVAGVVEAVGEDVFEFKKGDRVAGMHVMMTPGGAFAEFAVLPSHTTFHLPATTTYEEAATIPLAALTAAFTLNKVMGLPGPWQREEDKTTNTPLVVYGASTAIGAFAIKLASAANIHPIIAVGSSTSAFLKEHLDAAKGDALVDYTAHETPAALAAAIQQQVAAAGAGRSFHAFDAVSTPGTYDDVVSQALAGEASADGKKPLLVVSMPGLSFDKVHASVEVAKVSVGDAHDGGLGGAALAGAWSRLFGRGLREGWLKPHPHEVVSGGLGGLEGALKALKNGEVRAKKLVGRIAETPGLA